MSIMEYMTDMMEKAKGDHEFTVWRNKREAVIRFAEGRISKAKAKEAICKAPLTAECLAWDGETE